MALPEGLHVSFIGKAYGRDRDSILEDQTYLLNLFNARQIFLLTQVHGGDILDLADTSIDLSMVMRTNELSFDGLSLPTRAISSWQSETLFVIKTADCLPILLLSNTRVLLLHAGWRGLASGILENAVTQYGPFNFCWIAPHICFSDYEVGLDVIDALGSEVRYRKISDNKFLLDLGATAICRLLGAQRAPCQIYCSSESTYSSARLHSYRRDSEQRGSNLLVFSYKQPQALISGD